MTHFAQITDGVVATVITVIVAEQQFIDDHCSGTWVQTSYNTRGGQHFDQDGNIDGTGLRFNYAGIGHTYDATRDAFIAPSPYPSWVLDEATCQWAAPTPYPDDGKLYTWDENTTAWVEVEE
tara:strand:- start:339 stop:704 length:366 start_codon:yes stop_codon:yes gene_type:complete